VFRAVVTVGGWTLASRILGFARDVLIAAKLGAGPVADAFFVALKLPNLFRRLFGEGAFNAAFVPAFAHALAGEGRAAAQQLAERMSAILAAWLALLTLLGVLFMPQVLTVLAPGFLDEPLRFGLAVELTRITFPYLWLICLTALVSGVLNGLDRFAAAAAAPVLFNLMAMTALLALTPFVATPGHALAWGILASGFAQLALVWFAARRAGMALRLIALPRVTPDTRIVLKRMVPGVLGSGVTQINLAIDLVIASLLPAGAISYLYYADRLAQLPLGVIGAAIGTALLPLLARQVRLGHSLSAHRAQNRAVEFSLALALPAAVALALAAQPIVAALFERGAFGPAESAATAAALIAYAVGLPAFVLVKAFAPAFFARGDTATPVKVGLVAVAANLALNLVLAPMVGHWGIALSTSIAAAINAGLLGFLLHRRRRWRPDRRLLARTPRLFAAVALMALAILAVMALPWPPATLWRLVECASIVGVGLAVFFGAAQAIGAVRIQELRALRRRAG
jgi:putative peptidoglycan lipid II flippase